MKIQLLNTSRYTAPIPSPHFPTTHTYVTNARTLIRRRRRRRRTEKKQQQKKKKKKKKWEEEEAEKEEEEVKTLHI